MFLQQLARRSFLDLEELLERIFSPINFDGSVYKNTSEYADILFLLFWKGWFYASTCLRFIQIWTLVSLQWTENFGSELEFWKVWISRASVFASIYGPKINFSFALSVVKCWSFYKYRLIEITGARNII